MSGFTIENGIALCTKRNLISAAYRLPGGSSATLLVQKNGNTNCVGKISESLNQNGFLVHAFDSTINNTVFIKADFQFNGKIPNNRYQFLNGLNGPPLNTDSSDIKISDKKDFINLLEIAKEACRSKTLKKIVLSRIVKIEGGYKHQLPQIFELLCQKYPNAFVFFFNTGGEIWIGASPEPLLISGNNEFHTSSIAGTRAFNQDNLNVEWNSKEKEEQSIVSDYIADVLQQYQILNYTVKGPYLKKAGNLIHLRTDFKFTNQLDSSKLGEFIENLHPTPAVCGFEKQQALNFILKNEVHNRQYYAGFLGPVGIEKPLSLFVNLRSMKVYDRELALFVGGGITAASDSQSEWDEMELKAETLRSIINQQE